MPKRINTGYTCRTYANKPRNRVSHQDKMAKPRVLVQKPGFCVSPDMVQQSYNYLKTVWQDGKEK